MFKFAICEAHDILELNETKEYTLTSTFLVEQILTIQLNSNASKLWQLLYTRSRFNKNLEITISFKELAELLSRSTRSIHRYVDELVNKGFLVIHNNFYANGGKSVNTFLVRFPKNIIEKGKQQKTRITKTPNESERLTNETSSLTTFHTSSSVDTNDNNEVEAKSGEANLRRTRTLTHINDKSVIRSNDNTVIFYNNINNNTNNNVVSLNSKNQEQANLLDLKNQLLFTTNLCKQAEHEWVSEKDPVKKYILFKKFSTLDATCIIKQNQIDSLNETIRINSIVSSIKVELNTSAHFINNLKGGRQLPHKLVVSIESHVKKLQLLHNHNMIVNEVIYEIRFGTLVYGIHDKNELDILHATNIAIKLIKESKWRTPVAFFEKVNKLYLQHNVQ